MSLRPLGIVIFIAILLLGYLVIPEQRMGVLPLVSLLMLAAAITLPFIAIDLLNGDARSNAARIASVGTIMTAFGLSALAGLIAFILAAYSGSHRLSMIGIVISAATLTGGILLTRSSAKFLDEQMSKQAIDLPRSEIESALVLVAAGALEPARGTISALLEKLRCSASDSPLMPAQFNRALLDHVNVALRNAANSSDAEQLARLSVEFDRLLELRQHALVGLRSQK